MEFTEIEKRMLHQTEGTERYAVQQELSMASRYGRPHTIKKGARADLGVPGNDKEKPQKIQEMDAKKRHAVSVRCRFCSQNCFKMS